MQDSGGNTRDPSGGEALDRGEALGPPPLKFPRTVASLWAGSGAFQQPPLTPCFPPPGFAQHLPAPAPLAAAPLNALQAAWPPSCGAWAWGEQQQQQLPAVVAPPMGFPGEAWAWGQLQPPPGAVAAEGVACPAWSWGQPQSLPAASPAEAVGCPSGNWEQPRAAPAAPAAEVACPPWNQPRPAPAAPAAEAVACPAWSWGQPQSAPAASPAEAVQPTGPTSGWTWGQTQVAPAAAAGEAVACPRARERKWDQPPVPPTDSSAEVAGPRPRERKWDQPPVPPTDSSAEVALPRARERKWDQPPVPPTDSSAEVALPRARERKWDQPPVPPTDSSAEAAPATPREWSWEQQPPLRVEKHSSPEKANADATEIKPVRLAEGGSSDWNGGPSDWKSQGPSDWKGGGSDGADSYEWKSGGSAGGGTDDWKGGGSGVAADWNSSGSTDWKSASSSSNADWKGSGSADWNNGTPESGNADWESGRSGDWKTEWKSSGADAGNRHDRKREFDGKGKQICGDNRRGSCPRGEKCKYSHETSEDAGSTWKRSDQGAPPAAEQLPLPPPPAAHDAWPGALGHVGLAMPCGGQQTAPMGGNFMDPRQHSSSSTAGGAMHAEAARMVTPPPWSAGAPFQPCPMQPPPGFPPPPGLMAPAPPAAQVSDADARVRELEAELRSLREAVQQERSHRVAAPPAPAVAGVTACVLPPRNIIVPPRRHDEAGGEESAWAKKREVMERKRTEAKLAEWKVRERLRLEAERQEKELRKVDDSALDAALGSALAGHSAVHVPPRVIQKPKVVKGTVATNDSGLSGYSDLSAELKDIFGLEVLEKLTEILGASEDVEVLAEFVTVMLASNKPRDTIVEETSEFLAARSAEFVEWVCKRLLELKKSEATATEGDFGEPTVVDEAIARLASAADETPPVAPRPLGQPLNPKAPAVVPPRKGGLGVLPAKTVPGVGVDAFGGQPAAEATGERGHVAEDGEDDVGRNLFEIVCRDGKDRITRRCVLVALKKEPAVRKLFGLPATKTDEGGGKIETILQNIQDAFELGSTLGEVETIFQEMCGQNGAGASTIGWPSFSSSLKLPSSQARLKAALDLLPTKKPSLYGKFIATRDWTLVPEGVACQAGLEYKLDMRTGKKLARLPPS